MTSRNEGRRSRPRKLELSTVSLGTLAVVVIVLLQLSNLHLVQCQSFDGNNGNSPPGDKTILLDYLTGLANDQLTNLTRLVIHSNLARNSSYCIDDP